MQASACSYMDKKFADLYPIEGHYIDLQISKTEDAKSLTIG